jgi:hypothetical protein
LEDYLKTSHIAEEGDPSVVVATIVERQPDLAYLDGLAAVADALVLQVIQRGCGGGISYRVQHKATQSGSRYAA